MLREEGEKMPKITSCQFGSWKPVFTTWNRAEVGQTNMATTIPIAVEQLLENDVQEISRDGQETYAPWVFK